jgi:hypothetical protein
MRNKRSSGSDEEAVHMLLNYCICANFIKKEKKTVQNRQSFFHFSFFSILLDVVSSVDHRRTHTSFADYMLRSNYLLYQHRRK